MASKLRQCISTVAPFLEMKAQDTAKSTPHMVAGARRACSVAGFAAILFPCHVLANWTFGIESLRTILPRLIRINPVTACAFVVAGISLLLFDEQRISPTRAKAA